ncbi:hypothetical protein WJX72_003997 [[Myrmecia] bisecta]|uniref:D-isomer specific 2-hydroxyacid dehydrogenase NAD-binding domain-containing protein n=1 Tax=[Myrmecia] bisecta TaxID=41462 RepID=A0AAW1Q059_9CHLO
MATRWLTPCKGNMTVLVVGVGETRPLHEHVPVPPNVEFVTLPATGPFPPEAGKVEFLVLSPGLWKRQHDLFPHLPNLKVVQTMGSGVDKVAPLLPRGKNITLCNAAGVGDAPVSEWVLLAILAMQRRLPDFLAKQQEGRWARTQGDGVGGNALGGGSLLLQELEGKTVVIIGHGSIGRAVEARLKPFGTKVIGVARSPRPGVLGVASLPAVAPQADILVVLAPYTTETHHLVDAAFLKLLKPGALIVNAARGGLIDQQALLEALQEGRVRAALDVTDPEPLPDSHPLWSAPNILITPHIAGNTPLWLDRSYRFVKEQIERFVKGKKLHNVQQEYVTKPVP